MDRILNIVMAIVEQTPWFVIGYTIHKVYSNKPKQTEIIVPDKITIISKR